MTTILEKFGLTPVTVTVPKGLDYIPQIPVYSEQTVGIEVEVENTAAVGRIPKGSVWTMITDGSLRNHGNEFITAPIPASSAPAVLNQLMTGILNQDCSFSPRTSAVCRVRAPVLQVRWAGSYPQHFLCTHHGDGILARHDEKRCGNALVEIHRVEPVTPVHSRREYRLWYG